MCDYYGGHLIIKLLLLLLSIANNEERNTKTRSNIKTSASKQQLLETAAETHFYRKRL